MATTWELEPHTAVKHLILERYLDAWFPIMGKYNGRLIYLDGFAGPGEYSNGEVGSPMIAIKSAKKHLESGALPPSTKIIFLFVESNKERAEHLLSSIDRMELPDSIETHVAQHSSAEVFQEFLKMPRNSGSSLTPTFAFVDPFGFSGIPMTAMKQLLANKKCELLVNLMIDPINRFLAHPKDHIKQHIEETFGTDKVHKIAESTGNKVDELLSLYKRELHSTADFVGRFDMMPRGNRKTYSLFFASNNAKGFEKIKESMWKADPRFGSEFTSQGNRLTDYYSLVGHFDFKEQLFESFTEKAIVMNELERFVIEKTNYLPKHLREVLKELEDTGRVTIEMLGGHKRRGQTFPKDKTRVQFG